MRAWLRTVLALSDISAVAAVAAALAWLPPSAAQTAAAPPAVPAPPVSTPAANPPPPGKPEPGKPAAAEAFANAIRRMQESIATQRTAVRKQFGSSASFFTLPWSGPTILPAAATTAPCDPTGEAEIAPLIAAAATAQQLKPALLRAVIRQESAFRPCAVSAKGAMGLMQLMPETVEQFQVADAFDPAENVHAGAKYLKQLMERFKGDLKLALAAYNAGPARVEGTAVPAIPETQTYVQQILSELEKSNP
jgi:soluble lytic murein transglycosylase-like protein